jgi:hypothetical protein
MAVLEAVLAVVGLIALAAWLIGWQSLRRIPDPPPPSAEADLAAPYREGLHAAIRMQGVAQDLEQQLYAEALRQAEDNSGDEA